MKNILVLLLTLCFLSFGSCLADTNHDLRDYNDIELSKGSFIPVVITQDVSTLYCDEGTKIKFISTTDLYLYEINIIPKNSEFFGYIEKINEPIIGTNASLTIKVTKLKLPDGFEIPMRGYIYTISGNIIGGEMTAPASFIKKPSYKQGFIPQMGYVPGPSRKMGEHKSIAAGADLLIVLTAPLTITHTVMN